MTTKTYSAEVVLDEDTGETITVGPADTEEELDQLIDAVLDDEPVSQPQGE